MPYIGTDINYGNLAKQTGTGDGADTTPIAALTYTVPSSESILVFLDGVCQVPSTDFTATGTTLTFTTAPANGVAILVMFLGRSLDIGTPADNTVSNAKMTVNSVDSDQYVDGSIDEAHIATDAVNFATHLKAGTDGELITWDASGDPAAVAVGTATHVLTSNGAGAAPTFQAAAGGLTKILTTTISSPVAAVAFNSTYVTSSHSHYMLVVEGLSPSVAGDEIGVLCSVNNGVGFPTHKGMRQWGEMVASPSDGWGSVAYLLIGGDIEETPGEGGCSATVHILDTTSTTDFKFLWAHSITQNHGSSNYHFKYEAWSVCQSTTAVNYIKVYNVNGNNLDAGKVTLYGYAI